MYVCRCVRVSMRVAACRSAFECVPVRCVCVCVCVCVLVFGHVRTVDCIAQYSFFNQGVCTSKQHVRVELH